MAASTSASATEDVDVQTTVRRSGRRPKLPRMALDFEDIETDSPASISEEESTVISVRGRGRGRGRGGRRGGRVFRGRQFEEGEEERLVQLHEERKEKADEMIDRLTEEEKTEDS